VVRTGLLVQNFLPSVFYTIFDSENSWIEDIPYAQQKDWIQAERDPRFA